MLERVGNWKSGKVQLGKTGTPSPVIALADASS